MVSYPFDIKLQHVRSHNPADNNHCFARNLFGLSFASSFSSKLSMTACTFSHAFVSSELFAICSNNFSLEIYFVSESL